MTQYYLAIDGQQRGPFSKEQLKGEAISADTLVWRSGLTEWVAAGSLPDLSDLFEEIIIVEQPPQVDPAFAPNPQDSYRQNEAGRSRRQDEGWFAMFGPRRVGPSSIDTLISHGLVQDTPVWHEGMADWQPASMVQEVALKLNLNNQDAPTSAYQNYGYTQQNNPYQQPMGGWNQGRENYLTLAIVATIVGLFGSCIGLITGIIAIVYANKANNEYAAGRNTEAASDNNTAKILSWITLGIGVIGLICMLAQCSASNFLF